MMGDVGMWGNFIVAGVFFVVGLYLMDVINLPWGGIVPRTSFARGWKGALLLGLIFGIGLGPCTFAYMAPMLGITFRLADTNLPYGILLLLAYGLGHCSVIVAAGTSTEIVQRYLNWNEKSKGTLIIKKVCGVLVILGGLYLLFTAR